MAASVQVYIPALIRNIPISKYIANSHCWENWQ